MSAQRLHRRAAKKSAQQQAQQQQKQQRRKIGQYDHARNQRHNNPPAGIALMGDNQQQPDTQYQFDPHLDPQLRWHQKQQRNQLNIPVHPLHIHERIDPRAVIRAVQKKNGNGQQLPFEQPQENPPLERAVQFYQHQQNWTNRLVAGDSLLVINSLLEKESMAGKVQCVYMDPPYGIKYGSNFQPFVGKRDVKDGEDKDLTGEPQMIRAFRDTWELGIHSYLSYLRDRLALCRELLTESGSCFVQISDENVHLVRCIMDEIFGRENFVSLITFTKTSPLVSKLLARRCDYIIWYANDKDKCKYRPLFMRKNLGNRYVHVELKNGERRKMTQEERENPSTLPEGAEPFALDKLQSTGYTKTCYYDFEFEGRLIKRRAHSWQTNKEGMKSLIAANRVWGKGEIPGYVRKYSDFPFQQIDHLWGDSGGAPGMVYVVETNPKIIQRCILMTTDPGDLVFDPTCGSGTTAVVAEQWGRRWITCDASRVALAIARQRLLTANFPYYNLRDERAGVSGGFVCRTVPHITLKSIANQERPPTETLHDQPEVDRKKARIAGPFTVEGLPSPVVVSPEEIKSGVDGALDGADAISSEHASSRHAMWARELADNGARGRDGETVHFSRAEACGAGRYLHLEVETAGAHPQPGFVSFGPQHAPMGSAHVARALEEAALFSPRPKLLVFAAFAFDPQAAKTLDEFNWPGGRIVKATMDPDLHVRDLKRHKRKAGDAAFWLMGRPDAELRLAEAGEGSGEGEEWIVEVRGFDYYNPRKPAEDRLEKGEKENIAMWMLDTDYDGRQLYPRQVFFPLGGKEGGWGRLSRALRAELDAERMEKYRGTVSLPFQLGDFRRAAVKIVDDSGIESIRVLEAPES